MDREPRLTACIVFVQLGENPAPTLMHMARIAKNYLTNSHLVLITDQPCKWQSFPGKVMEYNHDSRSSVFQDMVNRHSELKGIAGGYWLYTPERLFVLKLLDGIVGQEDPIIHLESDVFSFINAELVSTMVESIKKTAVPRYSATRGIGSILFSPSISQLKRDLALLEGLLSSNPLLDNDMDLLGLALNKGLLEELPSRMRKLESGSMGKTQQNIFDGLALGQYLFGQDPLHTGGKKVTGYVNPDFDFTFQEGHFQLKHDENGKLNDLYFITKTTSLRIANLHFHSKTIIDLPSLAIDEWTKYLFAANYRVSLVSEEKYQDLIHTQHVRTMDKMRRARKIGYWVYMKRALLFRLRKRSK